MPESGKKLIRDVGAILVAAGSGARFGTKKQFLPLRGRPLLLHAVEVFAAIPEVLELALVVPGEDVPRSRELVDSRRRAHAGGPEIHVLPGGSRRQDSVTAGLDALGSGCAWVLVHDAARALIRREDVLRVLEAVREQGAAAIGYPAVDSVKEERDGRVLRNLPRERVWLVQTPQGASAAALRRALDEAARQGRAVTDEAALLEALGETVALVEGPRENIKITYPEDIAMAEHILSRREERE